MRFRGRLPIAVATVAATLAAGGAAYAVGGDDRTRDVERAIEGGTARNVIMLVGDGMGDSEITLARNYAEGAGGHFDGIDDFTLTGDKTTFSVEEDDPDRPDFDPDSAATATAFSAGKKTSDGRVSTLPGVDDPGDEDGNPDTVVELAKKEGLSTGLVTTARLTDATPAAASAHVPDRGCEGPEDTESGCPSYAKSSGGPGSIAEQQIANPRVEDEEGVDVLLGGGSNKYAQATESGDTVTEEAVDEKDYRVVRTEDEMRSASNEPKLLGLFDDATSEPDFDPSGPPDPQELVDAGNLDPEWSGQPAALEETPANDADEESEATGSGNSESPQRCDESSDIRSPSQPDLDEMEEKALDILDESGGPGFFLQVEGASIDKRSHTAQPCEQIGETVAFDRAVEKALDFAREDGNTLVIVTGDHGHAGQIVESSADTQPIGCSAVLETDSGANMRISYATVPEATGAGCVIQEHTGTQIRIAADGPQAANVVGLGDDTDTFDIVARALDLGGASGGGDSRPQGGDDDDDGGNGRGNGSRSGRGGGSEGSDGGGPAAAALLGVLRSDCGLFRQNFGRNPSRLLRCQTATYQALLDTTLSPAAACEAQAMSKRRRRGSRRSDHEACVQSIELTRAAVDRLL